MLERGWGEAPGLCQNVFSLSLAYRKATPQNNSLDMLLSGQGVAFNILEAQKSNRTWKSDSAPVSTGKQVLSPEDCGHSVSATDQGLLEPQELNGMARNAASKGIIMHIHRAFSSPCKKPHPTFCCISKSSHSSDVCLLVWPVCINAKRHASVQLVDGDRP